MENKSVFLLQLTKDEMQLEDPVELIIRMCKKLYYGDEYDPLWFKRPFFFNQKNLKGLHLYKRILKYLYHDTYDSSQKRSKYSSGKTLD